MAHGQWYVCCALFVVSIHPGHASLNIYLARFACQVRLVFLSCANIGYLGMDGCLAVAVLLCTIIVCQRLCVVFFRVLLKNVSSILKIAHSYPKGALSPNPNCTGLRALMFCRQM